MNDRQSEASNITVPSRPDDVLPETLFVLPLPERPFFPAQALPLMYSVNPWLETFEKLYERDQRLVGICLAYSQDVDEIRSSHLASVGTVVRIQKVSRDEGQIQFLAQGVRRFRVVKWLSDRPPFLARVEYPEIGHPDAADEEPRAYAMAIINSIKELIPLNPLYSEELKFYLNRFSPNDPAPLADFAASLTTADKGELQAVLETFPVVDRLKRVLSLLRRELDVARLQANIREQVDEQVSEHQRKFFLREQLKAIQRELGIQKDDREADSDRFRERLKGKTLPAEAQKKIDDELEKLQVLESGSPEYAVTRNYLDVVTGLPWGVHSRDKLDLNRARRVLDRDHAGLEDVKRRIIEFLAVGALRGEVSGSILLLVGPPGVGKTSIGRSIAQALGRKFYRFSLGGMRDEAEIKGHRRTYIGAMPGKVIQAIREAGTANPVVMLDEIDKLGVSFQGDPASALLEVLDPEQNSDFLDHYLDTRFDLSKVLFVCTANQMDTIPGPLLDRMEVLRLAGYITEEKVDIAQRFLWPRLLSRAGMRRSQLRISRAAIRQIAEGYAREAGVRSLEKHLGRIVRRAAVELVQNPEQVIRVGVGDLRDYLGAPHFRRERPSRGVGVVTGLAWTSLGGVTLSIEASRVHLGRRGFRLTGQLGNVMQESANIAYSYVAGHANELGADSAFFDDAFIHLHVPEGATQKDGPSAGITMATALLSLARKQEATANLAMTGELTLTGQVLAIGGVREKIVAARRAGIREVILPEANRGDYEELPDYLREGLTAHFARDFRQVLKLAFSREDLGRG